ncbi:MAG: SdrD B-like domain-containing protein [Saprospiraceae bacterium]
MDWLQELTISQSQTDSDVNVLDSMRLNDPAMITGLAWNDLNENGLQDFGEPNFANVPVSLSGTNDLGQNISLNTTTRTNGLYDFDGLRGGTYTVTFTPPGGYEFTLQDVGTNDDIDSDPDPLTGQTAPFTLNGSAVVFQDAGLREIFINPTIEIGDFVWYDTDKDGLQGPFEAGAPNITVRLYNASTNQVLASDVTDSNGEYLFVDVSPGTYYIIFDKFTLPFGYQLTHNMVGMDDELDSNPDTLTGRTPNFTIVAGQRDELSIDAGIFETCDNITNGGLIAANEELCGQGSDPSPIVDVALPSGGTGNIEYIWMYAHTPVYNGMGDPNWSPIPGTNSPSYDPGPINQSTYYLRCSRRVGCTDYIGETNIVSKIIKDLPTAFISVSPQQACTNTGTGFEAQDAGFGAVYSWVFQDGNPSGINGRVAPAISWPTAGIKNVILTVTRNGCTARDTNTISIVSCLANWTGLQADRVRDSHVAIDWSTEGDDVGTIFRIEKSMDGINFETIKTIAGTSTPSGTNRYQYSDYDILPASIWYRIKHMNAQGEYEYSDIVEVEPYQSPVKTALVFPNPSSGELFLNWKDAPKGTVQIQVFDMTGRMVHNINVENQQDIQQLEFPELPVGVYMLNLIDATGRDEVIRLSVIK